MPNIWQKILKLQVLFAIFFIFTPQKIPCFAANMLDVVINEICWMGNKNSANDEWIELYNNTEITIDLTGWKIISKNGTPEINLEGKINQKGFFLLERTDENSVPEIKANLLYKGALENKGEFLQLIDEKENIIDELDCSQGWFEGKNESKKTMERINQKIKGSDKNNWQTSKQSFGTPMAENILYQETKEVKGDIQTESEKISYSLNVKINEIMPSPDGPDVEQEFIELFNQENIDLNISEWYLKDTEGATKKFIFPKNTIIKANDFLVFFRPETKITLNNTGDRVELFNPNNEIVDAVNYEKAFQGKSFSKIEDNWTWTLNLTPGKENKEESESKVSEIKDLPTSLSETQPKDFSLIKSNEKLLSLILTALSVSLASTIFILFLKKRLKVRRF